MKNKYALSGLGVNEILQRKCGSSMLKNKKLNNVKKLVVWSFVMIVMVAIAFGEGDKSPLLTAFKDEVVDVSATDIPVDDDQMINDVENVSTAADQVVAEKQGDIEVVLEEEGTLMPGGDIQSLNFKKDMGIRDALRFLAVKYQRNIVPTSKVDGQLAFNSLYNVSFDEAMEAILGTSFRYEQSGNLIRVFTAEEYKKAKTDKERMEHRVFTLSYISAAEALKLITPVLSGSGIVNASSESETGVPTGESISSDSGGGDTMAAKDIIVVFDYPENIVKVAEVIKNLDERPKQVLIEATILSAKLTEGMEFGVDFNLLKGVSLTAGVSQVAGGVPGTPAETFGFADPGPVAGLRLGFTSGNMAGFITALETITDTTILANPKIMAVNKQLGQVYIGTKLGYRAQTTQTDGGSTTSEVKFLDTGTKLSFRPYIGDDGYIRMDIHPKDSSGSLNADKVPDETSTELATNIIVKDGETIVIGGLFRDKVVSGKSQVPVLGDIPILGEAFKKTTDTTERQEVIVLLTPHIIKDPCQANGKEREQDVLRKRDGANNGLHWFGRTKLVEDRYEKAAKYYVKGDKEAALRELDWVLEVQPTHLESIRLQEKILEELYPDDTNIIERKISDKIEAQDTEKWGRW